MDGPLPSDCRGQATPEWLGLVCLVSLALCALASLGVAVPGAAVAKAIADRLVCAVGLGDGCGGDGSELVLAYGGELAGTVAGHAPTLEYEDGMHAVPVDFRSCREDACANAADSGAVRSTFDGQPVTLFTHVVDCRDSGDAAADGFDCSGDRAGNLFIQYFAYYPGSRTSRGLFGDAGFHADDWEGFQVRVGPDGAEERASSHHGYNGQGGDPLNDTGWFGSKSAWTPATGLYDISGGSHAGRVGSETPLEERLGRSVAGPARWTGASAIHLVPIESLRDEWDRYSFAVTPPWLKEVYRDPEWNGT
jgi:hypothetical protein